MSVVTKRNVLQELVTRWQKRLYLSRYVIVWHWLAGDQDNAIGRAETNPNKYKVHLWFDDSEPWDVLRNAVIHELLHVWQSPLTLSVGDLSVSPYLPRPAYDTWHAGFLRAHECLTDEMSAMLGGVKAWEDRDLEKKWAAILRKAGGK